MAKITYNICVLIVTYSNRWQFLEQVLKGVTALENVTDVIIVDNASTYNVAQNCALLLDSRIKVLTHTENLGSSGGYKAGLECFMKETEANFVWLLDDDNLPAPDALEKLTDVWASTQADDDQKALFSLRLDRKQHVQIGQGEDANRFLLVKNSFMGFNLFRVPVNQYYKFRDSFNKQRDFKEKAAMAYAPYGGMFFHKRMVDLIGYPDERFFVYADDSEYTYRMTEKGSTIWLVPASQITDVDKSYGIKYVKHFWRSMYLDLWSFRTYYQVRNSIYFYSRFNVTNHTIYGINKRLFLLKQWLISKLTAKQTNYKKLLGAIQDGLEGKLGMVNPEKYS
ncbi:MAG: glycosyltransferase [Candidatus Pedobacter colombiensis]|uniref:Glycosyltransferase n=1 Tax=Candidatus Pedobacter colombiensis TaxID=3121371 RepID=A0AAJ5WB89_9SPHI|nr:glycosyltransferase [Pedobacter sp.]WEK19602.1 MAG: glycosyltransferase [Pedobacter sp.]